MGWIGAMMTAFYMFRLYATTFLGKFRGTHEQEHHLHESPLSMTLPLIILAILSVVAGFVGIPEVFAPNSHALANFLDPIFAPSAKLQEAHHLSHSTEYILIGVSVAAALIAALYAWVKFSKNPDIEEPTGFGKTLANKWYVDEVYDTVFVKPVNAFGKVLNLSVEKNLIDWVVNGVGRMVNYGGRQLRWLQSGQVGSYVLLMVLSILAFFALQFLTKK